MIEARKARDGKMRSTGVVRKLDELGRIVLPAALRKNLDIHEKDSIEIFVDGERIILAKFVAHCIFCDSAENEIKLYNGKLVCVQCMKDLEVQLLRDD